MADLNSHFQYPHYRRRFGANATLKAEGSGGAVHFASSEAGSRSGDAGAGPAESMYMGRAQEYDQALRQSRMAAAVRKRSGGAASASVMGMSTLLGASAATAAAAGPSGGGVAASVFGAGELAAAPSVVLGDSQGSVQLGASKSRGSGILPEEVAADGGVGSGLGESYVDGARRSGAGGGGEEEEEEGMEDGGVLGLLAQIYGRRDGPAVVM